ncbi:MAG: Rrf2 family transcriptional regulator [Acidothermus sp.]|nr:Rrf2 family transcriptional regulator [Acidothermus sp.]
MHISAKTDYAMRAMLVLAEAFRESPERWVKAEEIAEQQRLPRKFLEAILADLRRARLVESLRGAEGGYRLAKPPDSIHVADVMRAVDGPLAEVRGLRPENVRYEGAAAGLQDVWVAVRAGLRAVLERVSVEDVARRRLPEPVQALVTELQGWIPRY